jgi:hypothetical protein
MMPCRVRPLSVITRTAQPAEKDAFEQLGVETVGLGAPMLVRYGYARCMDNMGLDAACPEPARQRKTVPASPSKATTMRSILRPVFSDSSHQRCNSFSNTLSSTASFFSG